jgi:hypothetical protein
LNTTPRMAPESSFLTPICASAGAGSEIKSPSRISGIGLRALISLLLVLAPSLLRGAALPEIPPAPSRAVRTNATPAASAPTAPKATPGAKATDTKAKITPKAVAASTNAAKAANSTNAIRGSNAPASGFASDFLHTVKSFHPGTGFYQIVGLLGFVLVIVVALKFRKPKPTGENAAAEAAAKAAAKLRRRQGAVHSCNVVDAGADARKLWQFDARSGGFVLGREHTVSAADLLPQAAIARGWGSLWQRKLNVAWLPPEQVFLRIAHLPQSNFDETFSMVELQLEKLSPMPVAQVVWSLQILPHTDPNLQTVLVTIAARAAVEEFLGKLEGQGFLADRLEVPMLDLLQATPITEDGAWIFPAAVGGHDTALVAWWSHKTLQHLDLLTLPPSNRPASLKEQLTQMAWSGEMEGWLTAPPSWRLVADPATAQDWEPALQAALGQSIQVQAPPPAPDLAALTAKRAVHAEPRANLLPPEFALRYQQQFVDRLWMRGLGAALGLYLAGLAVYGVAVGYATIQTQTVEQEVVGMSLEYTNALQLKAKVEVLTDRAALKFAALNCYQAVAEKLPAGVTLDSFNFSDGRKLTLVGTAPADQTKTLIEFEKELHQVKDPNDLKDLLFDPKSVENMSFRTSQQGVSWTLALELRRSEAP